MFRTPLRWRPRATSRQVVVERWVSGQVRRSRWRSRCRWRRRRRRGRRRPRRRRRCSRPARAATHQTGTGPGWRNPGGLRCPSTSRMPVFLAGFSVEKAIWVPSKTSAGPLRLVECPRPRNGCLRMFGQSNRSHLSGESHPTADRRAVHNFSPDLRIHRGSGSFRCLICVPVRRLRCDRRPEVGRGCARRGCVRFSPTGRGGWRSGGW